jgi:[acyl-carrier-protein] S-malonyltransferase
VLKAKGAKRAVLLPVSAPFHSTLMKPAAEALRDRLSSVPLQPPRIPVINNIDVAMATEPEAIREALYRQAFGPVRWSETIQAICRLGIAHILECGPGKVLSGLVKRIEPNAIGLPMFDPATLAEAQGGLA